jgi:UDP-GlcNAc3NAcA epimerase
MARKKVVSIVGARPQFIKLAPLNRALVPHFRHIIVHTGQHYDSLMSDVFFRQLNIPKPSYNLRVGSGSHATQTAKMLMRIERVLIREKPDIVLVYGDTNSTLAGALAAKKLGFKLGHVEAGMRSFNRDMPEELNRVTTDHLADYHFVTSNIPAKNLRREGITQNIFVAGDVMIDVLRETITDGRKSNILAALDLFRGQYGVLTIHRASNTNTPQNLVKILRGVQQFNFPIIFPVHPRTKSVLTRPMFKKLLQTGPVALINPLNYSDMLGLVHTSKVVLTDSGGLQKEAYFLHVPCITLRTETEWLETVRQGWNSIVGVDSKKIQRALSHIRKPRTHPIAYGNGRAAIQIVHLLKTLI